MTLRGKVSGADRSEHCCGPKGGYADHQVCVRACVCAMPLVVYVSVSQEVCEPWGGTDKWDSQKYKLLL